MKGIKIFLLIFIFVFSCALVMPEEDEKEEVPAGMEIIQVGEAKFVVPKGAATKKAGDLIILDSASEYTVRKFLEIEERVAELEAKEEELQKEVKQLKQALDDMQKTKSDSKEEE